jgi:alpha-glucuronidase
MHATWRRAAVTGLAALLALVASKDARAEDGYELWLRYRLISDRARLETYRTALAQLLLPGASPTLRAAREELLRGLAGLLGREISLVSSLGSGGDAGTRSGADARGTLGRGTPGVLIAGTKASCREVAALDLDPVLAPLGGEGYLLRSLKIGDTPVVLIAANTDVGVLYGAFALLRRLQTGAAISALDERAAPRIRLRMLDHWDNLDRTVERGYAGFSLWDWWKLPDYRDPRYTDYARANASIGVNGAALTNVNADASSLTHEYLVKAAALADVFRPYGIRVYLSARFSAPVEIGGLKSADPLDPEVAAWWRRKADEIHALIPDFGGFLVKANSEGQPGPQDYGRSHADGANMLADALAPHGGVVIWRAFVYSHEIPVDRAKQAYDEFHPLDGSFRPNVLVQVKNGPIDFQPREPFHPLFGAMPRTPLMLELQITQEYLGFATHLVYLGPLFREVLAADTYAKGPGSFVAKVVDGRLDAHELTGIAGVANTGTDRNWCGSVFACANWYAFGRLAWDHTLSAETIADEWLRMTFTSDPAFLAPVTRMMLGSREAAVDYMAPLGLVHLMARDHHHGPGPWVSGGPRPDWTSVYYHRAGADGIGFDRTATGSNAVSQYAPPVRDELASLDRIPEQYLLFFHHVPWDHELRSGRSLWQELLGHYDHGVRQVSEMREVWAAVAREIDPERREQVGTFLAIQEREARWWRDACSLYFQTLSGRPFPAGYERPAHTLEEYMAIHERHVPGIR